jgi:hypothetical protein
MSPRVLPPDNGMPHAQQTQRHAPNRLRRQHRPRQAGMWRSGRKNARIKRDTGPQTGIHLAPYNKGRMQQVDASMMSRNPFRDAEPLGGPAAWAVFGPMAAVSATMSRPALCKIKRPIRFADTQTAAHLAQSMISAPGHGGETPFIALQDRDGMTPCHATGDDPQQFPISGVAQRADGQTALGSAGRLRRLHNVNAHADRCAPPRRNARGGPQG